MSRELLFYVEGATERRFVAEVLAPHFASKGIICHRPIPAATSRRGGRTARGGIRSYNPIKVDIHGLLKQWKSRDIRFTTLLDLYGLPDDFPGKAGLAPNATGREKAKAVADAWKREIDDRRFTPFIFSYEFETLVLSHPDSLLAAYPGAVGEVSALKAEISTFQSPEEINDSPGTAPSKRIIKHLRGYRKPMAGIKAVESIGLPKIRQRCPHFNEWMTAMENLSEPRP